MKRRPTDQCPRSLVNPVAADVVFASHCHPFTLHYSLVVFVDGHLGALPGVNIGITAECDHVVAAAGDGEGAGVCVHGQPRLVDDEARGYSVIRHR